MKHLRNIRIPSNKGKSRFRTLSNIRDDLTGLYRYGAFDLASRELPAIQQSTGALLLLFVDADNLKQINDSWGHEFGDELIVSISKAISNSLPESSVICRKGGDEFVAAVSCKDQEEAKGVASQLLFDLNKRHQILEREILLSCSIGASVETGNKVNLASQEKKSDIAMYWAKRNGKGQLKYFSQKECSEISMLKDLSLEFPAALALNELSFVFQPIYRTDDRQILGAEALIRWDHKEFGMISPELIVQIASTCGGSTKLGLFVLEAASREALNWPPDRYISINFMAADFTEVNFAGAVLKTLNTLGFSPSRLRIEITEAEFLEFNEVVIRNFDLLRGQGVKIGIDDFGTGYSSMGNVDTFPVDFLKIDKSLVLSCNQRITSKIFLRAIKAVADSTGFELIAEGVETVAECAVVRGTGICNAQGFYFCKPVEPSKLSSMINLPPRQFFVSPTTNRI